MKKYRIRYEIGEIPSYEYHDEDEPIRKTIYIKAENEEQVKEKLFEKYKSCYNHYIKILKIVETEK